MTGSCLGGVSWDVTSIPSTSLELAFLESVSVYLGGANVVGKGCVYVEGEGNRGTTKPSHTLLFQAL